MTSTPDSTATLDARTLHGLQERSPDTLLLDVRAPAEFEAAHIPGAYNVPLHQVSEHRERLGVQLEQDVVLVCRSGARAHQAHAVLSAQGLTGLQVLDGGMSAWEETGAPVNRGRRTWEMERQVRLAAGSMVVSGILLSQVFPRMKWFSGAIGTGLVFAAVSNTCAMGNALARMPWNQAPGHPGLEALMTRSPRDPA